MSPLPPAEFAARFQDAARVLWTIAAGILGDPAEAEDVLQEAAMVAFGKRAQFAPGTSFPAWMASFVRNVARNHARKTLRRATRVEAPAALEELVAGSSPDGGREPGPARAPVDARGVLREGQADFDDRILAGLRELSPDQRAALLLRTVRGLSFREVAQVLGIPEGTAMSHVYRARVHLRQRLGGSES
ncbi:MAG: RNA polymerase sigma factor [Planctomycetota bacterium]